MKKGSGEVRVRLLGRPLFAWEGLFPSLCVFLSVFLAVASLYFGLLPLFRYIGGKKCEKRLGKPQVRVPGS